MTNKGMINRMGGGGGIPSLKLPSKWRLRPTYRDNHNAPFIANRDVSFQRIGASHLSKMAAPMAYEFLTRFQTLIFGDKMNTFDGSDDQVMLLPEKRRLK